MGLSDLFGGTPQIKATRVDTTVVAFFKGKVYQKDFRDETEVLRVYDALISGNVTDENEMRTLFLGNDNSLDTSLDREKDKTTVKKSTAKAALRNTKHDMFSLSDSGTSLVITDTKIAMPHYMTEALANAKTEEESEGIINFFFNVLSNPNPEVRSGIYEFMDVNGFHITRQGLIVGFRNVDVKEQGNDLLARSITNAYNEIRRMKKAPSKYCLIHTDEDGYAYKNHNSGVYDDDEVVCSNIEEAYLNLENVSGTVYTDQHSHSTHIVLGQEVRIPREECDETGASCSKGLHTASESFLRKGYYGSITLATVVHPADVVALPSDYKSGKFRSCAYTPVDYVNWDVDSKLITEPVYEKALSYEVELLENNSNFLQNYIDENGDGERITSNWEQVIPNTDIRIRDIQYIQNCIEMNLDHAEATMANRVVKVN